MQKPPGADGTTLPDDWGGLDPGRESNTITCWRASPLAQHEMAAPAGRELNRETRDYSQR